jgi:hypothetical protein
VKCRILGNETPEQENVREGDVSFYVMNVDLISLRQKYNYKEHERTKPIETDGRKLILDALKLIAISGRDKSSKQPRHIPTWPRLKYNTYKHSRE